MKNSKYILLVVAVVLVVLLGLQKTKSVATPETIAGEPSKPFCYIWNTEAGDSASLKFTVSAAVDSATGTFAFLPAEKDSKVGDFSGIVSNQTDGATIHGIWNTTAEGVTNKEEIFIKVGNSTAAVGFGEMKLRDDGVYVYAHPESISYSPTLQQTDCNDSALK
jgi:hypothetical protein